MLSRAIWAIMLDKDAAGDLRGHPVVWAGSTSRARVLRTAGQLWRAAEDWRGQFGTG